MTDRLIPSDTPTGDELAVSRATAGQPPIVPARQRDRGIGPFKRLVLRAATVIDGTGAPPIGPTDIVVENNRITLLKKVTGNLANAANRPAAGDREIDCRGKWVTPILADALSDIDPASSRSCQERICRPARRQIKGHQRSV